MMARDGGKKEDISSLVPQRPAVRSTLVRRALDAVKAAFAPGINPEDSAIAALQKGTTRDGIIAVTGWSRKEVERFLDKAAAERADFFITGDPQSEYAIFKISSGH